MRHFKDFFSRKVIFSIRDLTLMGVMLAICVCLNVLLTKYITPDFKLINISYLPGVIVSVMLGPVAALVYGFAADTLKFLTLPSGPYVFGYAFSEMLTYLIYSVFFFDRRYKRLWQITLAALLSQFVVLCVVTMGVNYIWQILYFGDTAGKFFTAGRMLNRAIQFPAHVALVAAAAKLGYFLESRSSFTNRKK